MSDAYEEIREQFSREKTELPSGVEIVESSCGVCGEYVGWALSDLNVLTWEETDAALIRFEMKHVYGWESYVLATR